jgi:thiamine transport system permease protein
MLRSPHSSSVPLRPLRRLAGAAIALGIAALVVAVLVTLLAAAGEAAPVSRQVDIIHLVTMTSIQAGLSTLFALVVGMALAWALNRLRFLGRDLVVGLFATAIVTPGLVLAFGLLAVWGRAGWVNQIAMALTGRPLELPIFGLLGILMAHTILDGAFAARILLARLDTIADRRLKTGQSLGLTPWQRFQLIDWPAMAPSLPGLAAIIFLLAFTSFPIVLLLGGGPANQTLEVAIYSAVRLDFDLRSGVMLALVQIGICGGVVMLAAAAAPVSARVAPSRPSTWRDAGWARLLQWLVLGAALVGFALPQLAILWDGMAGLIQDFASTRTPLLQRPAFWDSFGTSLLIGGTSAAVTLTLAILISLARAATPRSVERIAIAAPAYAYLAVPAVVLSFGLFLIVRNAGIAPARMAPTVVVVANALLSLPFALATLAPPMEAIVRTKGKLIRALDIGGLRQFVDIEWPLIRREAGIVIALAFCFSLGDLGVIALFGTQDFATLPLLMYRALGTYRTNDAAIIAAVLLVLTLTAFVLLPRLLSGPNHADR